MARNKKTSAQISQEWMGQSIFGHRYVFFNSLIDTNNNLYNNVLSHFNNLNNQLNQGIDPKAIEGITYMEEYLNFIKRLAEIERKNEEQYLKTQLNYLRQHKDLLINNGLEEVINNIENIFETEGQFDYEKMINILNMLRKDTKEYEKNITDLYKILNEQEKNPLDLNKIITKETQNGVEEKTIKEWYITGYNKYKEIAREAFGQTNKLNLTQKISKETDKLLKDIAQRPDLIKKIKDKFMLSERQTEETIKNYVMQIIIDNFNNGDFLKKFEDELNNTTQLKDNNASKVFQTKDYNKSLEELALTTGTELANYFLSLETNVQTKLLNELERKKTSTLHTQANELINIINSNNKSKGTQAYYKGEFTKTLKDAIFNRIAKKHNMKKEELINELNKLNKDQRKKYVQELLSNIKETFSQGIQHNLTCSFAGPSSVAEVIANPKITNIIEKIFTAKIPGKEIELKNDVIFTMSVKNSDFKFSYDTQQFFQQMDNLMNNFMKEYNNTTKGTTDYAIAAEIYKKHIIELGTQYKKLVEKFGKDSKEVQKIIETFEKTFFGAVSVKEYEYYNNQLGFHGGSLGGSFNAIEGVKQIMNMYEAGGLSHIDIEVINEAILNCGEGMIGGQTDLLQSLKNYLIGGAIMGMFDEGFSNTKPFLELMREQFEENIFPGRVHLFHLQTLYIPASYVLQNIYENLRYLVADIEQNIPRLTSEKVSNTIEIINHVKESDFNFPDTMPSPERWNTVSDTVQTSVTIHTLFMAGILDLFENLQNGFKM